MVECVEKQPVISKRMAYPAVQKAVNKILVILCVNAISATSTCAVKVNAKRVNTGRNTLSALGINQYDLTSVTYQVGLNGIGIGYNTLNTAAHRIKITVLCPRSTARSSSIPISDSTPYSAITTGSLEITTPTSKKEKRSSL